MQILGRGVPVSAFGSRYAKPSSLRPLVLEPQISCKRLMGHHGKRHVADELHICSELVLPPRALRNAVWFGAVGLQWQESAMKNPFCTAQGFLDTRYCYAAALIKASAANHS